MGLNKEEIIFTEGGITLENKTNKMISATRKTWSLDCSVFFCCWLTGMLGGRIHFHLNNKTSDNTGLMPRFIQVLTEHRGNVVCLVMLWLFFR